MEHTFNIDEVTHFKRSAFRIRIILISFSSDNPHWFFTVSRDMSTRRELGYNVEGAGIKLARNGIFFWPGSDLNKNMLIRIRNTVNDMGVLTFMSSLDA